MIIILVICHKYLPQDILQFIYKKDIADIIKLQYYSYIFFSFDKISIKVKTY